MAILRFLGYLLMGLLSPLAIFGLLVLYAILTLGLSLHNTWLRAKRDPRYDPHWYLSS